MSHTATLLTVDGGQITVTSPYELRALHRQVPSGRWDPAGRVWRYPATPAVALALAEAFSGPQTHMDPSVHVLLEAARAARAVSEAAKGADTPLRPLTITRTDPPLRRHQLQAIHVALPQPAIMLAMAMGTMKTRCVLELIQNRGHQRTLVACPLSVVKVWEEQLSQYLAVPYRAACLNEGGVTKKCQTALTCLEQADRLGYPAIIVCNYESLIREPMQSLALQVPWDFVVADESHALKAAAGVTSRLFSRLGDRVPYRACLTGTPMPHSPGDVYAQYRFLDKTIYGTSHTAFKTRYCIMGGWGGHEVMGWQHQDELQRKFYQRAFRVEAADVLDLPATQHVYRTCHLSRPAERAYLEMERHMVALLDAGEMTASNALVRLLRLQQLCSGVVTPDDADHIERIDDAKEQLLGEVLDELETHEPIVVFCRFRSDLASVHRVAEAQGRTCAELSGSVKELDAWQEGQADVLAVQIQSGSLGVSMVRAHYAVFMSGSWSLGEFDQALARLNRPGQTLPVTYVHLLAEVGGQPSIDRRIYDALQARRDVVAAVLEGLGQEKNP